MTDLPNRGNGSRFLIGETSCGQHKERGHSSETPDGLTHLLAASLDECTPRRADSWARNNGARSVQPDGRNLLWHQYPQPLVPNQTIATTPDRRSGQRDR